MRKRKSAGFALIAAGLVAVASVLSGSLAASPAEAGPANDDPVRACDHAAMKAESDWTLPAGILAAIATVESGRGGSASALPYAWPWSINAGGRGVFLPDKTAAILAVQTLKSGGQQVIDVGCFQVNLFWHPDAFASLDLAFDPQANAQAAARILARGLKATGSWEGAIALYHSATPVLGANYLRQVQAAWPWAKARSTMSAGRGADAYAVLLSPEARQVRVISGTEVTQPGAIAMPRVVDWPGPALRQGSPPALPVVLAPPVPAVDVPGVGVPGVGVTGVGLPVGTSRAVLVQRPAVPIRVRRAAGFHAPVQPIRSGQSSYSLR